MANTFRQSGSSQSFILQPNLKNLFRKHEVDNTPVIDQKSIRIYFGNKNIDAPIQNTLTTEEPRWSTTSSTQKLKPSTWFTTIKASTTQDDEPFTWYTTTKRSTTQEDDEPFTWYTTTKKSTTFNTQPLTWFTTAAPLSSSLSTLFGHLSTTPQYLSSENPLTPTTTETPLIPAARTLITFEAVLTGLVYLSFGIFLFKMIQKTLDAKKTEELLTFLEGRSVSDAYGYYNMSTQILPAIENISEITISKTTQAIETWKVAKHRPKCLPLYLCRRRLAQDEGQTDLFFSATSVGAGIWNAIWDPEKTMDYMMASWMGMNGMSCDHFIEPCIYQTLAADRNSTTKSA